MASFGDAFTTLRQASVESAADAKSVLTSKTAKTIGVLFALGGVAWLIWELTRTEADAYEAKVEDMDQRAIRDLLAKAQDDPNSLTTDEVKTWGTIDPSGLARRMEAMDEGERRQFLVQNFGIRAPAEEPAAETT